MPKTPKSEIKFDKILAESFRDKVLKDSYEALFNMAIEQTYDIKRLKDFKTDKERMAKINELNSKIADLLESSRNKMKKDKDVVQGEVEKLRYVKSQYTNQESKIYQEISKRTLQVKGMNKMIDFLQNFDYFADQEILPYAVINETRYKMTNNILDQDEKGNMILHLEPAKK